MKELTVTLAKKTRKPWPTSSRNRPDRGSGSRADIAARQQWKNFIPPKLTDPAVKQYYDTNKPFFDKVMVRASHILDQGRAECQAGGPPEWSTTGSWPFGKTSYPAKIKFEDAAKKYSECPSKENGGDIGLFPYKFAVLAPFANAAFSMKIGEISEVVATDFGYHIIKVTDRTNGQPSNFESIKTEVKEILFPGSLPVHHHRTAQDGED